jgi:peptidyl-prolyl cis-trans isomerase SurA
MIHLCSSRLASTTLIGLILAACSTGAMAQRAQKIDRIVAVVNDEAIAASELEMRLQVTERQIKRQNQPAPPREEIIKQVLERVIVDRAMMQYAREKGIRAEDFQVDQTIARIAAENKTNIAALKDRVERDGMSFNRFREDIRDELTVTRLREREFESKVVVSEAEVDRALADQVGGSDYAEYNLAQILLRVAENATPEVVERQRLRGEEILKQLQKGIDFARLSAAFSDAPEALTGGSLGWRSAERLPQLFVDAAAKLRPNETSALLRSANGFHILRLNEKRSAGIAKLGGNVVQAKVQHILLRIGDASKEAEVKNRLEGLRQQIINRSKTFEQVAKEVSTDASASNGGDLGWVLPGDTVPEFEKVMDSVAINEVSQPFATQFGMHILRVTEKKTGPAPEDRVRSQAKNAIRERKLEQAFQEWVQQLRDRAYVEIRSDES